MQFKIVAGYQCKLYRTMRLCCQVRNDSGGGGHVPDNLGETFIEKKQISYKVLNFFYCHWQWCCHPGDVYRNKNGDSLLHSFDKILVAKNAQLGLIYYTFNCMDIAFIQCHWVPENKYQDFWIHRSPVIVRLAEENVSGKHKWMVPIQDATRCLESSDLNVFLTMLDISGLGMNDIIGLLLKTCLDKKKKMVRLFRYIIIINRWQRTSGTLFFY